MFSRRKHNKKINRFLFYGFLLFLVLIFPSFFLIPPLFVSLMLKEEPFKDSNKVSIFFVFSRGDEKK